jgi:hypothetical protein
MVTGERRRAGGERAAAPMFLLRVLNPGLVPGFFVPRGSVNTRCRVSVFPCAQNYGVC